MLIINDCNWNLFIQNIASFQSRLNDSLKCRTLGLCSMSLCGGMRFPWQGRVKKDEGFPKKSNSRLSKVYLDQWIFFSNIWPEAQVCKLCALKTGVSRCLEKTLRDLCCKNKSPVGLFSDSAQQSAGIPEDEVSDNFISFYIACSNHAASSSLIFYFLFFFCNCGFRDLL